MIFKHPLKKELFFLFLITIVGGLLRFYNLDWDQGQMLHPDERNIANAVSHIRFFDKLNPQFFAYGGFPIYLARLVAELMVRISGNLGWVYDWGYINIITRFFSGVFSTITIVILFYLAKEIFNKEVAFLSALFFALTVSSIQSAHFGTVESMLVFMIVFLYVFSIRIFKKPDRRNYIYGGIVLGLAIAVKMTALSFTIIPLISHLLTVGKSYKNLVALVLSAFLVFTLFSPYTFLSLDKFMESMRYESGVATGALSVPYTLQFEKTAPYIFQIKNLFWQMGPLAFLIIPGIAFLALAAVKNKNKVLIIFLAFPVLYFAYVGLWQTKFIRYMLPVLPFFVISASYFLYLLKKEFPLIGRFFILLFLLISALWVIAFSSIYVREQTRITASKWIYDNIPFESKIVGEHWDDGLPLSIFPNTSEAYKRELLTIYEPDNQAKINYYAMQLSTADYIIINSRRLYGTLMYRPDKYPVTSKYYRLLFAGDLGFAKVAEFSSYPSFFGVVINDDASEESFQVFDHPRVMIFKNMLRFSSKTIIDKLTLL